MIFCIAVDLQVEPYLAKSDWPTKEDFIDFVQLAEYHVGRLKDATNRNQPMENEMLRSVENPARALNIEPAVARFMLLLFIDLMRPSREKSTRPPKADDSAFWNSSLKDLQCLRGSLALQKRLVSHAAIWHHLALCRHDDRQDEATVLAPASKLKILIEELCPHPLRKDLDVHIQLAAARIECGLGVRHGRPETPETPDSGYCSKEITRTNTPKTMDDKISPVYPDFKLALGLVRFFEDNHNEHLEVCSHKTMMKAWLAVHRNGWLGRMCRKAKGLVRKGQTMWQKRPSTWVNKPFSAMVDLMPMKTMDCDRRGGRSHEGHLSHQASFGPAASKVATSGEQ